MSLDPVMFSTATNMFHSIANEMGSVMLLSAYSSIAREAKDTSTCLLDAGGRVVAQSIMIPMHMNSLSSAVGYLRERFELAATEPDEVYVMNHPYANGQHLHDIIMMLPIFHAGHLCGFAGSISHHVDVGGSAVISSTATELFQEGIIIPPMKLKENAAFHGGVLEQILGANVRAPGLVLGDYRAQHFACLRGRELLQKMVERFGADTVAQAMTELQDYSERYMRTNLARLPQGTYHGEDFCDPLRSGEPPLAIRATVTVSGDQVDVDLSGCADQVEGPVNSPIASTFSAVFTFFVSMMSEGVPVNDGSYRPITVRTRKGSICDPIYPAPVRSRMSTCYRIFSALRAAFATDVPDRVAACGHETTTSVAFSRRTPEQYHVYHEVIAGGLGASMHGAGCDGVAQPLSNTGNTPIEVMELDLDFVRVRSYGLITGSGGKGKHHGGMGIRKVYEIVSDDVTFCSNGDRCNTAPWGACGGEPGSRSAFRIQRGDEILDLGALNTLRVQKGDLIIIETCGGGGWGKPEPTSSISAENKKRIA
ncbi:hydantoinase B/oxoprolinase family protein [Bradyrhizobium sp. LHD-71]|uniref:hydantoinase B/oxoprolinase family protein n=1 Tax=Bradyrhizobium sp. LHD-71 TaxID=3072141 RepID=UPI00280E9EC3|nr:hydantoinase B/oxoprolinase family protein [Bradyrhizobium sp. LHD-71]MDQ8727519.1 hydantoinase B/oxoprolinase family protein [Bradyrhizobium sp. LHD-71]